MGSIVYIYGYSLYINLTNKCTNSCDFCIRNYTDNLGDAENLWLDEEPGAEQVLARIREEIVEKKTPVEEIIFCGYGEPTERLEVLLEVARGVRAFTDKPVRLNTNGLSDLINGRPTAKELSQVLDAVSVSLNAPTPEKYQNLCHSVFGEKSLPEIIRWTKEIKGYMQDVRMSVVSVIPEEEVEECRRIAQNLGVRFRVR